MKPTKLLARLMLPLAMPCLAQTQFEVEVSNPMDIVRKDAPVTCRVTNDVRSALVTLNGNEIPCQLDDINGDGLMDELFFLADLAPKAKQIYNVELFAEGEPRHYPARVYVDMMLTNKKIKENNKQDLYISQLTVDRGVNPYWMLHYACILLDIADGKKLDFDELILEKRGTTIWVHFAVRPKGNRRYVDF